MAEQPKPLKRPFPVKLTLIIVGVIALFVAVGVLLFMTRPTWLPTPILTFIDSVQNDTKTTSEAQPTDGDIDAVQNSMTTEQWEEKRDDLISKAPVESAGSEEKIVYQAELITTMYGLQDCDGVMAEVDILASVDSAMSPNYYINIIRCYENKGDTAKAEAATSKARAYIAGMEDGEEKTSAENRLSMLKES